MLQSKQNRRKFKVAFYYSGCCGQFWKSTLCHSLYRDYAWCVRFVTCCLSLPLSTYYFSE